MTIYWIGGRRFAIYVGSNDDIHKFYDVTNRLYIETKFCSKSLSYRYGNDEADNRLYLWDALGLTDGNYERVISIFIEETKGRK